MYFARLDNKSYKLKLQTSLSEKVEIQIKILHLEEKKKLKERRFINGNNNSRIFIQAF